MLKYIIFILIFNVLHFAQAQFDIYEISDRNRKPVENPIKRQVQLQGNITIANDQPGSPEIIPRRPPDTNSVKKELNDKTSVSQHQQEKVVNNVQNPPVSNTNTTLNKTDVAQSNKNSTTDFKSPKHVAIEHQGAVLRGFYVFLGLSVLIVIYFVFKAFRLRPGAPPPTTVRKYGIVGRRSDMEMLPLPLAEEEDDDTLFDMGTQVNR